MVADLIPRSQGYVSVGSRPYNEWQTLAFEATTDREEVSPEAYEGPLVDQISYPTQRKILKRQDVKTEEEAVNFIADELQPDRNVIEEDMIQDEDNDESDDIATKNYPRSIKVLVTDHTNEETIDDNRI